MMEITLVLHNIRSCYNVGAIIRTAEGFGLKKVILSGYTPRPHDENLLPHLREKIDKEIHKTALGAEELVKVVSVDDIKTEIVKCRTDGVMIVGLENHIDAKTYRLDDPNLKEKIGDKIILILGEEVDGIDPELHNLINTFLEIPMRGKKESFNVSVATGVALYGLLY